MTKKVQNMANDSETDQIPENVTKLYTDLADMVPPETMELLYEVAEMSGRDLNELANEAFAMGCRMQGLRPFPPLRELGFVIQDRNRPAVPATIPRDGPTAVAQIATGKKRCEP